jgi:uncharacterized protein
MDKRIFSAVLPLVVTLSACAQAEGDPADVTGEWVGQVTVIGQVIGFEVALNVIEGVLTGLMDIPMQGAYEMPLSDVIWDDPTLSFTLEVPGAPAFYEGELADGVISGEFSQAGAAGVFEMSPYVPPVLDYPTEEVRIETDHGPVLAGTLSLPEDDGPHPAVLLITGSGPQNRDEEIFGFKPFFLIADHLANQGYAVLRCDDRGFGDSTGDGSTATTADLTLDYAAQIEYLQGREEIDPERVFVLGHSEGSLIAGMLATERDLAGIIMLAGPAVPGDELLLAQSEKTIMAEGGTPEEVDWNTDFQRRAFEAIRTGTELGPLYDELRERVLEEYNELTPAEQAALGSAEDWAAMTVAQQRAMLESPWMAHFIDYDPWTHLARIECPALAVFGELDVQVPPEANIPVLEAGAAEYELEVEIIEIPGANHLFQAAVTGALSEYPTLTKEFVPELLETVTAWLDQQ